MMLDTLISCASLLRETAMFMISLAFALDKGLLTLGSGRCSPLVKWNALDFDVAQASE